MSDSVVALTWPIAGNGFVVLNVSHRSPNAEAIALLEPVVAAIEAYQAAVAELLYPLLCGNCGKEMASHQMPMAECYPRRTP